MLRISQFPAAASAAGPEELVANQGGTTRKLTVTQLRAGLQPGSASLTALAGLGATGIVARTGADTVAARAIVAGLGLAVTNGSGVGGNPTVALAGDCGGVIFSNNRVLVTENATQAITPVGVQSGTVVRLTSATAVTVTLPANGPLGKTVTYVQGGTGQAQFVAGAGATLVNRSGHTRTAGQHAMVTVMVTANVGGNAAVYTLSGDTVA